MDGSFTPSSPSRVRLNTTSPRTLSSSAVLKTAMYKSLVGRQQGGLLSHCAFSYAPFRTRKVPKDGVRSALLTGLSQMPRLHGKEILVE